MDICQQVQPRLTILSMSTALLSPRTLGPTHPEEAMAFSPGIPPGHWPKGDRVPFVTRR